MAVEKISGTSDIPRFYPPTKPMTFGQFAREAAEILGIEPEDKIVGERAKEIMAAIYKLRIEHEQLLDILEDIEFKMDILNADNNSIEKRGEAISDARDREGADLARAQEAATETGKNTILALGEYLGVGIDHLHPLELAKLKMYLRNLGVEDIID